MPVTRRLTQRERVLSRPSIPGQGDVRRAVLYDTFGWVAAATVLGQQRLFAAPIGQAGTFNNAAVNKGLLHTNLRTASQLPKGYELQIWDICVEARLNLFSSITTLTILNNAMITKESLLMRSFLVVTADGKSLLEISPVAKLGAGYGVHSVGWGTANITAAADTGGGGQLMSNGSPNRSGLWNLSPYPLVIPAGVPFEVVIETPVGIVLPANTALDWWVHLDGVLAKPA